MNREFQKGSGRLKVGFGVALVLSGGIGASRITGVMAQNRRGHMPPTLSRERLGTISFEGATRVERSFEGGQTILKLKEGPIYVEADMDIDADGSSNAKTIDPGNGQLQTSLTYRGVTGQARFVDAETVPYFVLPANRDPAKRFFTQMGIQLGDVAAVVFRDKVEYAIFADVGPATKIGEGSIKLAQSLGHDPFIVRNGKRIVGRSIPKDVIFIVFPGSRDPSITPASVVEKTRSKGKELFRKLGGKTD
jgi:hypothetical protein